MSLPMLESTQKLRTALQAKAKGQSSFRFYSPYDKVSRKDVLWDAWCRCRALANLYMRRFVLSWKTLGHQERLQARIVNYADDFVICGKGTADEAMSAMRNMMRRIKLTVNETKTKLRRVPAETFDFLGYTFGRCYKPVTGRADIGTTPSRKKVQKLCESISDTTGRNRTLLDATVIVERLNRKLRGWANYFRLGPVSKAYRAVDRHVTNRLRQWLCAKHKTPGRGTTRFSDDYLYQTLGLIRLPVQTRNIPWATRLNNTR